MKKSRKFDEKAIKDFAEREVINVQDRVELSGIAWRARQINMIIKGAREQFNRDCSALDAENLKVQQPEESPSKVTRSSIKKMKQRAVSKSEAMDAFLGMLEASLEPCNGCNGKGEYDHEFWPGLWRKDPCTLCKGSGKRLPKRLREFMEKYK